MAALYDGIGGRPKGAARSRAVCHAQARSAWSGGRAHPTLRPAISSPRRKGSWPLAANLPKGMRFSPPSIRQYFPPICGLHHRSSFFLRLRSRLARQCQERTCRQGAVHERANEQLYPKEPRKCLPTPSGSRSITFRNTKTEQTGARLDDRERGSRSGGRVGIGAVRIVIKQRLHFFAAPEERNGLASERN